MIFEFYRNGSLKIVMVSNSLVQGIANFKKDEPLFDPENYDQILIKEK